MSVPCPSSVRSPSSTRRRDERGSALAVVLMVSVVLALLGMGIVVMGETEALQARLSCDRQRSREAATAVVHLVAGWFAVPDDAAALPPPEAWRLDARRGDLDGDGMIDAACDGRDPAGQWTGYPLRPMPPDAMATVIAQGCGSQDAPDLLIEEGAWLEALARSLGEDMVIERIAVSGTLDAAGSRGLDISVRTAVRRGARIGARMSATGRVRMLPRLPCDEALAAGGDVHVADGAVVRWGAIRAAGDVMLPPVTSPSFPWSGLPRRPDGQPVNYRTGGVIDWKAATHEREYVLTEMIGRTLGGDLVLPAEVVAPELPDPWMVVDAGGHAILGSAPPRDGRQPWPYDPRFVTLRENLSFITQERRGYEPLLDGRLAELATLVRPGATGSGRMRLFLLDPQASREALWREGGTGPSRTAEAWLGGPRGEPVIAVFSAGGSPPPDRVTLSGMRGVIIVEAQKLVLRGDAEPAMSGVNMPGEPYYDTGIDADGDAMNEPSTMGNGRWDVDADGDALPDEDASSLPMFGMTVGPEFRVPNADRDPSGRRLAPHEPFLNFEWPADQADGPVRVRFRAELDGPGAPVGDVDGDGVIAVAGEVTTVGRDAEGALVQLPLHVHAVVANLTGDIVVDDGCQVLGSVRARGDISVGVGASVRFDAGLARHGLPDVAGLPRAMLAQFAGTPPGGLGRRARADGPPPPEDAPDPEPDPAHDEAPIDGGTPAGKAEGRPGGDPSPPSKVSREQAH